MPLPPPPTHAVQQVWHHKREQPAATSGQQQRQPETSNRAVPHARGAATATHQHTLPSQAAWPSAAPRDVLLRPAEPYNMAQSSVHPSNTAAQGQHQHGMRASSQHAQNQAPPPPPPRANTHQAQFDQNDAASNLLIRQSADQSNSRNESTDTSRQPDGAASQRLAQQLGSLSLGPAQGQGGFTPTLPCPCSMAPCPRPIPSPPALVPFPPCPCPIPPCPRPIPPCPCPIPSLPLSHSSLPLSHSFLPLSHSSLRLQAPTFLLGSSNWSRVCLWTSLPYSPAGLLACTWSAGAC